MSRQGLKDFVHAVEHSAALRREFHQLDSMHALLAMAHKFGFSVSETDLKDDETCAQIEAWFARSWIS